MDRNSTTPRRVVAAAMLMDDGAVIVGIRHYSPEMRATLRRLYPQRRYWVAWMTGHEAEAKPYHLRVKEQGFVDQMGVFLTREEAWVVAEAAGQILRPRHGPEGVLFSEDIY